MSFMSDLTAAAVPVPDEGLPRPKACEPPHRERPGIRLAKKLLTLTGATVEPPESDPDGSRPGPRRSEFGPSTSRVAPLLRACATRRNPNPIPLIPVSNAIPDPRYRTLATFDHRSPGEQLVSHLAAHAVAAHLRDERRLQRFWFLCHPRAGIHVDVPESLFHEAQIRLSEWKRQHPARRRIIEHPLECPECGSSRLQYPNMTRYFLLPTLIAHLLTALHVLDVECYCEDCHATWTPQPEDEEPEARPTVSAVR